MYNFELIDTHGGVRISVKQLYILWFNYLAIKAMTELLHDRDIHKANGCSMT